MNTFENDRDEQIQQEIASAMRNLPQTEVIATNGHCEVCETETIGLGNGLCPNCWDYVVNFSSPNIKVWPDTQQYMTIRANRIAKGLEVA